MLDEIEPEKRRNLGLAAAKILDALSAGAAPAVMATTVIADDEVLKADDVVIADSTSSTFSQADSVSTAVAVSVPVVPAR